MAFFDKILHRLTGKQAKARKWTDVETVLEEFVAEKKPESSELVVKTFTDHELDATMDRLAERLASGTTKSDMRDNKRRRDELGRQTSRVTELERECATKDSRIRELEGKAALAESSTKEAADWKLKYDTLINTMTLLSKVSTPGTATPHAAPAAIEAIAAAIKPSDSDAKRIAELEQQLDTQKKEYDRIKASVEAELTACRNERDELKQKLKKAEEEIEKLTPADSEEITIEDLVTNLKELADALDEIAHNVTNTVAGAKDVWNRLCEEYSAFEKKEAESLASGGNLEHSQNTYKKNTRNKATALAERWRTHLETEFKKIKALTTVDQINELDTTMSSYAQYKKEWEAIMSKICTSSMQQAMMNCSVPVHPYTIIDKYIERIPYAQRGKKGLKNACLGTMQSMFDGKVINLNDETIFYSDVLLHANICERRLQVKTNATGQKIEFKGFECLSEPSDSYMVRLQKALRNEANLCLAVLATVQSTLNSLVRSKGENVKKSDLDVLLMCTALPRGNGFYRRTLSSDQIYKVDYDGAKQQAYIQNAEKCIHTVCELYICSHAPSRLAGGA